MVKELLYDFFSQFFALALVVGIMIVGFRIIFAAKSPEEISAEMRLKEARRAKKNTLAH